MPLLWLLVALAALPPAASGAWWATDPLLPKVPPVGSDSQHPIDAFVQGALAKAGQRPAAEADRPTLIRRVTFDLLGLPPTPAEVEAFLSDTAPDAYPRLVTRLLESPRYGERWARHWMDAVHFAETHGHDQDRIRTNAWPYRDYLIASFNSDKAYPRFVREQVAGDVLYPDDPGATVALGFLAAGPWDESSLRDIREDTLDRQIARYLDRDDVVTTVMQTFTSLTVQCARCHDHKFDPISQQDYYALQAVFAGVDRANRSYDPDPAVHRRRQEIQALLRGVARSDSGVLLGDAARAAVEAWESRRGHQRVSWHPFHPEVFLSAAGASFARQADGSFLVSGPHGPTDVYTFSGPLPLAAVSALRLEVLPDDSLPQHGPGREPNGNLHLSEVQLLLFEPGSTTGRPLQLRNPTADFNQAGWTVAQALDGEEKTAWGIHPAEGRRHVAVFELAERLTPVPGSRVAVVLKQLHGGHCIGRPRLLFTDVAPPSAAAVLPPEVEEVAGLDPASRSDAQRRVLAAHALKESLERELASMPPPGLVYAAASDFEPDGGLKPSGAPRPVHVLRRGEVLKAGEAALPGALACISNLPARFALRDPSDEGSRRAALAAWLSDPGNPVVWRSIVNRVWQRHFGRGLVETVNDFGRMGRTPSHPELLDWLALWFRDEARGSFKQLHRLIVTSATYRESSRPAAAGASSDPDNLLLGRWSPVRLDSEQVRDAILQVSGRIDLRMGGPSDRQFDLQPGIHVTPRVDYTKFDVDEAAGRRRSVYRFLFRTLPDPFMDALDCPAGDQLTPVRTASVTVQQALALWNNAFVARHAEHFAGRLEAESADPSSQVRLAHRLLFQRDPSPEELRESVAYRGRHGLANLARLWFNSNEFMFVQ